MTTIILGQHPGRLEVRLVEGDSSQLVATLVDDAGAATDWPAAPTLEFADSRSTDTTLDFTATIGGSSASWSFTAAQVDEIHALTGAYGVARLTLPDAADDTGSVEYVGPVKWSSGWSAGDRSQRVTLTLQGPAGPAGVTSWAALEDKPETFKPDVTDPDLSATYVPADKTAINVLQAGASPAKTATENTTILNAVLTQAATEGRAVYFPATDLPIQINDALIVAGPGLTVYGDGPGTVAVQQTAWPKPFLDASTHDNVSVTGIKAINTAPRVSNMTAFRGNTLKNYSAFLYGAGNGLVVRNCSSDGFNAGYFNWSQSAAVRLSGGVVDGFEFRDGEFGVFTDWFDDFTVRNVWGDYSFSSGGSQVPHLIYVGAWADGNCKGLVAENLRATGSTDGSPFQFKGIVGGTIRNLYADGCKGVLTMMAMADTLIENVTSVNDAYSAAETEGSFCTVSTDPMTRVTIRNVDVQLVNDAQAIRLLAGAACRLENATVRVAHTTTNRTVPVESYDIEVRGEWDVIRPRVFNTGTNAWNAIGVWDGSGAVIRDPETSGVRIPVRLRTGGTPTTNATIYYDADKLGLHGTDGLMTLDMGTVAGNNRAIQTPSARARFGRRNLVTAVFDSGSGSGKAPGVAETGQVFTQAAGTWVVESGYLRKTAASAGLLHVDAGQADVEVSADILYRDANGLAFRVIDASNYLFARIRYNAVELWKLVGGTQTALGTTFALTPTDGRRYRLSVRVFGASVVVLLDGKEVIAHTLTGGDETTFGAATKHGIRGHTDTLAKWTDLRIDSLR